MADLLAIDACRPLKSHTPNLSSQVATPLIASEWEKALTKYPDRQFVNYIITGIREGFRIGFDYKPLPQVSVRNTRI